MIMKYSHGMPEFGCKAYGTGMQSPWTLDQVPDRFWRKIECTMINGVRLVLVYDEPAADDELQMLMFKLQITNAAAFKSIMVTTEDGETVDAPLEKVS
jgi:hypothetical protein